MTNSLASSLTNNKNIVLKNNRFAWAHHYYRINEKPYDINGREYLKEIIEEVHDDVVIRKSAQCGVSEFAVLSAFHFANYYKENIFYAFPNERQIGQFVQGRVDPRIQDSEELNKLTSNTNNIGIKQIDKNFIYFRGSQNRAQIISVDAGYLILDELDEMIQNHIPTMEKRLGASKYKRKLYLSTPKYENHGIDFEYNQGDQRQWYVKCSHCGKWQTLDFFNNISPSPSNDPNYNYKRDNNNNIIAIYICIFCEKELDNRLNGKWIPKYPERQRRSYHISKLFVDDASTLLTEWVKALEKGPEAIREFYNSDLGLPYSPNGNKLTDKDLNACRDHRQVNLKDCYMGVDVGKNLNVVIAKKQYNQNFRVLIKTVKEFEELDDLMNQYDVGTCIIDALPETRKAKEFEERFSGRVYLAYYNLNDKNEYAKFDKEKAIVRINRTNAMDYSANKILTRKTRFPMNINDVNDFYAQMKAPQKVQELNEKTGNMEYKYLEGTSPDHYYHANTYCDIAMIEQSVISVDPDDISSQQTNDEDDDYEEEEYYEDDFSSSF